MSAEAITRACSEGGEQVHYSAVLRALGQLQADGSVARVTLLRAYAPSDRYNDVALVCRRCDDVLAVEAGARAALARLADLRGFKPSRFVVEAAGVCAECGR